MEHVLRLALLILVLQRAYHVQSSQLEQLNRPADNYLFRLQQLLAEILISVRVERCFVIITDELHHSLYDKSLLQHSSQLRTMFYLRVSATEDLLAPHYQTIRILSAVRTFNCDLHLVTLLNGIQTKRFLRFAHKHRMLNTHQKFVFLHDTRILEPDMRNIWSSMVSSIFVKRLMGNTLFSISTVPYPNILNGIVVTKHLADWTYGKRLNSIQLFQDKCSNLKGNHLPVAVVVHVPMVALASNNISYEGFEVEIVRALGQTLNFEPIFYTSGDGETERWGRELPNGSYTGLIGQMTNRTARMAIGDLHLNKLYSSVMDLTAPHSVECLTFLTPESSQDNSWKTLIQPFSGSMWIGVLLSLFMVGTLFYVMSWIHALALHRHPLAACKFFALFRSGASSTFDYSLFQNVKFRASLNRMRVKQKREDLFDNFANCILLTYSMLMYVALPRMPRNWPLRVLTGWYWMYCILVTVTYRASFTAILANPAARITIDSLEDLARSRITATAWGNENRKFFAEAFDEVAQEIGLKLELVDDIYGVTDRIAKGTHAYYDNEFYLRYLRLLGSKRREDDEVLHVMRDCVVRMPIALGLEKNSPLKPNIDKHLQSLREGGLISKWLKDAIKDLPSEEQVLQEALMDLRKFWSSFVALGIGYFLSICAILTEKLHFKYIVQKHPLYDKYNTRLYYNFKRRFKNV